MDSCVTEMNDDSSEEKNLSRRLLIKTYCIALLNLVNEGQRDNTIPHV